MKYLLLGFLVFFLVTLGLAQETKQTTFQDTTKVEFEFTLRDGTRITGKIVEQNGDFYRVETSNIGNIKIYNTQVVSMVRLDQREKIEKQKVANDNLFGIRYFFFPTAIAAEKKKWFYSNQLLFFNNFTYGLTKHVSVGISFLTFVPSALVSPMIKITLNPESRTKFAVNAQYIFIKGNNPDKLGFFQAIVTHGDAQNNFTIGIGAFLSSNNSDQGNIATIGFVKKIGPKLSLISQNNIFLGSYSDKSNFGLLSIGLRLNRKMHAFDLGLFSPTSGSGSTVILLPYVGFNLRLNK